MKDERLATSPLRTGRRRRWARILLILALAGGAWWYWSNWKPPLVIPDGGGVAEWPAYGRDAGGTRYAPLAQITPHNVMHLEKAWEYHTGDVVTKRPEIMSETAFEATPILVEGTLYLPTPLNRVIALDPETGEERWVYDPQVDPSKSYANQLTSRGVAFWRDPQNTSNRIFAATNDARLIALDATTGELCRNFGDDGQVDLNADAGEQMWHGEYQVTSPPVVTETLVVVGSAVADNVRVDAPSGVVRAFDARTGELRWAWDLAPPDFEPTPDQLSAAGYVLGTPNVWAPMSVDLERDLLFVPTGNPAPDYYGGERRGIDFYGSSIVALRASTGEVVWHFQTVHHDLWDFDVPAQPTLTHVVRDGQEVPVVIQATKMGLIFTLHRETGEPIWPVEERPVPQSTVPGEQTSPTQPFPLKPPQLIRNDLTSDGAWGLYWGDKSACAEAIEDLHFEGMYTPPQLNTPTLMYPGNAGGTNWGGVAVDPDRQILVANVMDIPWVVTLFPGDEYEKVWKENPDVEISQQEGTPYAMRREMLMSPLDLPCNAPPWGTIAAIDLHSGDIVWQEPFGTVRDLAPVPIGIKYGVPNLGGPLVTESGLIFIGAAMDNYLRAFDIKTGEELWKGRLPAGGQATPMTYRLSETGKQYVVICAGGHGRGGTKLGDSVVAFALRDE